jgi:hypothetical protein
MTEQAPFALSSYNPDVLSCIANLSNDEVFTPPELANHILDRVAEAWSRATDGANLWSDKTVRFLDPCAKSGVFLREIVRRLSDGLKDEIPELVARVDHIVTHQVFGIGLTRLTAMLSRRSAYCSKWADGPHSIATSFDSPDGNVWFQPLRHSWVGGTERVVTANDVGEAVEITVDGRCEYCGANQKVMDRGDALESHAYAFIHTHEVRSRMRELFGGDMQFDVIIGNPPYQLNDGGGSGSSARPIYQKFIEQAQHLEPRFLAMIVPAKWYSGGKGLDEFRAKMLADNRIRYLADYPDSRDAFDGVDVAGGVCYFLWDRDNGGPCSVDTFSGGKKITATRQLDEFATFIRDNRALSIVHKTLEGNPTSFSTVVSSRKPFGLESAQKSDPKGELYLYASGQDGKIRRADVPKGSELIDAWKVLLSKTSSEHAGQTDKAGMKRVFSRIEVMPPGTVSTESYLVVGPFKNESEARNAAAYLRTRFVRFLVTTILLTQNISKAMFEFVPSQDFASSYTDEELYSRYRLTSEEVSFIEDTIRVMDSTDE